MAVLQWSERAWLATREQHRVRLTELFDALLRNQPHVGGPQRDTLQLDLPSEERPRYRFIAEKRGKVWRIDAKVIRPDLNIRFGGNSRRES
jgi:hypothetical protein